MAGHRPDGVSATLTSVLCKLLNPPVDVELMSRAVPHASQFNGIQRFELFSPAESVSPDAPPHCATAKVKRKKFNI